MNALLISLFSASIIFFFFAVTMFQKSKELTDEVYNSAFQKDFIWSKNAIRFLNVKDSDRIIDNFEARWIGKVDKSYLLYHIGKLIEEQCLHIQRDYTL